jgi:NAD(P)-dependent dehydrogenase (short-subunit alcohol dehydrogenase family)/4-hydroxybenzoate polyprenyltransferase
MPRTSEHLANLVRRSRLAHWGVHILVFVLAAALYASALRPLPPRFLVTVRDLLLLQLLLYPAAYLLNDFVDFEDDRFKRPVGSPAPWRPSRGLIVLLFAAGITWGWAAFAGIARLIPVLMVAVAVAYSVPPVRLKVRGIAGVLAAALTQRLLPFVMLCASHDLQVVPAALVSASLAFIGALFILHHQGEDLEADRAAGVRTWGVVVGRRRLAAAIFVADTGLLACTGVGWIHALLAPGASGVPLRFAAGATLVAALTLLLFRVRFGAPFHGVPVLVPGEAAAMHGRGEIRDRTVLLVGATGALGVELARLLGRRNCRLALVARDRARLAALQSSIAGASIDTWACDSGSGPDVAETYRAIVSRVGRIDVAIFAAGVGTPMDAAGFSGAEFERVLRTNLLGVAHWLDCLLPDFIARRSGTLVGVSSLAAGRGFPGGVAYCPSKAGLSVLFECLRTDLAPLGIRVHLAEPGFFASGMTRELAYTPFLISAERAARELLRGVEHGHARIRFPARARLLAGGLGMLPPWLFDRLMGPGHPMRRSPALHAGPRGGDDGREDDG